jgi:hypothetical protein
LHDYVSSIFPGLDTKEELEDILQAFSSPNPDSTIAAVEAYKSGQIQPSPVYPLDPQKTERRKVPAVLMQILDMML